MKRILRPVCILLILLLSLNVVTATAFANSKKDDQTYRNEETFKLDKMGNPAETYDSKSMKQIKEAKKGLKKDETLVSLKTIEMYVNETYDSDKKEVIDSHLMTNKEVEEYLNSEIAVNVNSKLGPILGTNVFSRDQMLDYKNQLASTIGADNDSKYLLTIILSVTYNSSTKLYTCTAKASWDGMSATASNGPAVGDDYIGLTWGGAGELKNSSNIIAGEYDTNQSAYKAISFSKAKSDSYNGYCWSFPDTKQISSTGKTLYAKTINIQQVLTKTYTASQGKETNVKLTYIHTYQAAQGSISFVLNAIPVITLAGVDKQWKVQVDVPGITY